MLDLLRRIYYQLVYWATGNIRSRSGEVGFSKDRNWWKTALSLLFLGALLVVAMLVTVNLIDFLLNWYVEVPQWWYVEGPDLPVKYNVGSGLLLFLVILSIGFALGWEFRGRRIRRGKDK